MTDRELVIVARAGSAPEVVSGLPVRIRRVVAAQDFSSPQELATAAETEQRDVLWLPAWATLSPEIVESAMGWLALPEPVGSSPRVAHAGVAMRCGAMSIPLTTRALVLSSPGAVDLVGDVPRARPGGRAVDLASRWEVTLPGDLNAHLEAVNEQSSSAARLRHAAGELPTWRSLTLTPLALVARGLARVHGSRREALPRLVIEAYREVLVAAKLWELAHGPAAA